MPTFKLELQKEYNLPPTCCTCGEPAASTRYVVGGSSWTSRRWISLPFPLCRTCEEGYMAVARLRRTGCTTSALLGVLLGGAGLMLNALNPKGSTAEAAGGYLAIAAAVILTVGVAAYFLLPLWAPREARDTYWRVKRAVVIKSYTSRGMWRKGTITIRFGRDDFAESFKRLNAAALLESKES